VRPGARGSAARPAGGPVVIGCGNEHRRDDACGLEVARALEPLVRGRARVVECDQGATGLLDLWDGEELVVVVDAVRSGRPAGTVHRMEVGEEPLAASLPATSTHGLSLGEAIDLGRSLGRLPGRLVIYGIEAGDVGMGVGLTAAVASAVPSVVDRIAHEVSDRAAGPGAREGPHA
jgi:hydrogenase maturation protease